MAEVVVIGAGVIGLSTALALEEAGHSVRILAAETGDAIVSSVAGAVWYPFKVGPVDKVPAWAGITRDWLLNLSRTTPQAGVDVLTRIELADDDRRPWWADAAPDLQVVHDYFGRPFPKGAKLAWKFSAPRAEPRYFLPWLQSQLKAKVQTATVTSLDATLADQKADFLINCTGLKARALTGDRELVGVFGQVVVTEPGELDLSLCIGDERDEHAMFYTIPRRGEVVVGGCAEPSPDTRPLTTSPSLTRSILDRAAALSLKPGPIIRERAGLRPYRPAVRLEPDPANPRIIHNYGHGGAGYTLCRGCAMAVASLLGR